jgi:hypothetical protein
MSVILFFGMGIMVLLVGFGITGVSVYHWIKEARKKSVE